MEYIVHKSLLKPDLVAGVPKFYFLICLMLAIIFWGIFGPWFSLLALVFYFPGRLLSKKDPDMIFIVTDAIFESDYLEG